MTPDHLRPAAGSGRHRADDTVRFGSPRACEHGPRGRVGARARTAPPTLGTSISASTWASVGASLRCPRAISMASGRPRRRQARWIFAISHPGIGPARARGSRRISLWKTRWPLSMMPIDRSRGHLELPVAAGVSPAALGGGIGEVRLVLALGHAWQLSERAGRCPDPWAPAALHVTPRRNADTGCQHCDMVCAAARREPW